MCNALGGGGVLWVRYIELFTAYCRGVGFRVVWGTGFGSLVWAYDVYGDLCSVWVFNGMTTALRGDLSLVIGSGVSTSYICTIFPQFSLLI